MVFHLKLSNFLFLCMSSKRKLNFKTNFPRKYSKRIKLNNKIAMSSDIVNDIKVNRIGPVSSEGNAKKNHVVEILATPEKSPYDIKEYRVIRLQNGLTALLVSDINRLSATTNEESEDEDGSGEDDEGEDEGEEEEEEDEEEDEDGDDEEDEDELKSKKAVSSKYLAAASLSVGVGSFEDPPEIPGLMHFLEHMVFMGSKKYPRENAFEMFVKKHGGHDNAHTDMEFTTFYFEIQEKYFKEGLDCFAQFFIDPLIREDTMKRERKAVHSEFQMALPDDNYRDQQLYSSMASPDHPMSKFTWGNESTLDLDISDAELHNKLHQLRSKYYSAQYMNLVVQSRESLDVLQEHVVNIFSEVPNNQNDRISYTSYGFPFPYEKLHKLYKVIPMRDYHSLDIAWALPSMLSHYRSKPLNYLAYLLGHEGRGSILSYLKKKAWAVGLYAGNDESGFEHNTTYAAMNISVQLTDEGFTHVEQVLHAIFQYVHMIKQAGAIERIFREIQTTEKLNFVFAEEETPIENAESLSENMHFYPPQDYLTGSCLLSTFDPQIINECLAALNPNFCNVKISSKQYESEGICTETEPWFGTKYSIEDIPANWLASWNEPTINNEFYMPEVNAFIPDNFDMLPIPTTIPEHPSKLIQDTCGELWYKPDYKFKLPRAYCNAIILMNSVQESARQAAMLDLFINLVSQHLMEDIYPAHMAQYGFKIKPNEIGIIIKMSGFNQKLSKCFELVMNHIENFDNHLNLETFVQVKNQQMKSYHNGILKPSKVCTNLRLSILQKVHWTDSDKLYALKNITIDDLQKEFASKILPDSHLQMLVQGNIDETGAIELYDLYRTRKLKYISNCPSIYPELQTMKILPGDWAICVPSFNPADTNTTVINYYQAGPASIFTEVLNEFLLMVMDEPVFDILRTQEQLGYHVSSCNHNTFGVLGLSIQVDSQADQFSADHVDQRIENFLNVFLSLLESMTPEDLAQMQQTLRSTKQTIDVTLGEEVSRNWSEICDREYVFDRLQQQIDLITNITRDAVVKWYKDLVIKKDNKNYRKLSVQVRGNKCADATNVPTLEDTIEKGMDVFSCIVPCANPSESDTKSPRLKANYIDKISTYKNKLETYPVIKVIK